MTPISRQKVNHSKEILKVLHKHFSIYISKDKSEKNGWTKEKCRKIGDEIGLPANSVYNWFRRECLKREPSARFSQHSYTKKEVKKLISYFNKNKGKTPMPYCQEISKEMNIAPHKLYDWFNHHRRKLRKLEPGIHPPLLYHSKSKLNEECLKVLRDAYAENHHPTKDSVEKISMAAGITALKAYKWFQAERIKRGEAISPLEQHNLLGQENWRQLKIMYKRNPHPTIKESQDIV